MKENIIKYKNEDIYFTAFKDVIAGIDLLEAGRYIIQYCVENNINKIMADCSELQGGHSVFDLLDLADIFLTAPEYYKFKEAVLVNVDSNTKIIENVKFWEDACVNRALNVRMFNSVDEALEWLIN